MAYRENLVTGQAYRVLVEQDSISEINTYDRLSFWTDASDVEFRNGSTLEDVSNTFFYAEGTLYHNTTEVTISGDNITSTGLVDIYVPDTYCKLSPNSIERNGHSITITFPSERVGYDTVDIPVRVVCKNFTNIAETVVSTSSEESNNENENENE